MEPAFPAACATLTAQLAIVDGEPSSETAFDTARIQAALNACPAQKAVELVASPSNGGLAAFLIAPITIPPNVTLLVDAGVTVFASRNPADYQVGTVSGSQEQCGTVGTNGNGCKNLISVGAGSGLMGYGVIDGRGGDDLIVNGAVTTQSWWDIAAAANGNGAQNNFILLQSGSASSLTLYKITLKNSAMFHVKWQGQGFTAWGVKVMTPYTARNTDGIDPAGTDITINHCSISDGDDMVAVSASSASGYISVLNTNTYSGHGISVGSYTHGGLTNMLVDHINFAGTAADGNATVLRLKSADDRGGLVQNVTYQNFCAKDALHLIALDPFYNSNTGAEIPQFSNVVIRNAHFLTEGHVQIEGADSSHLTTLTFDNVVFDDLSAADLTPAPQYSTITLGPGTVYPSLLHTLSGTGVTVTGTAPSNDTPPLDCTNAFPALTGELLLTTSAGTNLQTATLEGPASFSLSAVVQPAMSQVSYGAWTGMPPLQQPIVFRDGSTVVGQAALGANGTLATASLTGVGGGTHTYSAEYPGDGNYAAFTFGSVTVTVNSVVQQQPSITQATIPAAVSYGDAATFTATVTGAGSTPPTGNVSFVSQGTLIGTVMLTNGVATLAVAHLALDVGTRSVIATYAGDTNDAPSDSSASAAMITISPGVTTTTLVLPTGPVLAGSPATFQAVVSAGAGTPSGNVTFLQGSTVIDSAPLIGGTATISVTPAAVGSSSITATYPGGGNYAASGAAAASLQVEAPFVLAVTPAAPSITASTPAQLTLTITPAAGFTGNVAVTCTSPGGALACSLAQGTVAISSALSVTDLATVSLPGHSSRSAGLALAGLSFGALTIASWFRKRRGGAGLGGLFAALCVLGLGASGCGSSDSQTTTGRITITASANGYNQTVQITAGVSD